MISSISNSNYIAQQPLQTSSQSLTSEQKETISQVLSEYDSSNLTAEDASSIVEAFSEAGIQPSEAFATELADAGFDAGEIGDLAGVGEKGQQPPPPQSSSISSEELSSVVDYLDAMIEDGTIDLNSDTRSDDMYSLLSAKFGLGDDTNLIDVST